jgi:hypothetical protein
MGALMRRRCGNFDVCAARASQGENFAASARAHGGPGQRQCECGHARIVRLSAFQTSDGALAQVAPRRVKIPKRIGGHRVALVGFCGMGYAGHGETSLSIPKIQTSPPGSRAFGGVSLS